MNHPLCVERSITCSFVSSWASESCDLLLIWLDVNVSDLASGPMTLRTTESEDTRDTVAIPGAGVLVLNGIFGGALAKAAPVNKIVAIVVEPNAMM